MALSDPHAAKREKFEACIVCRYWFPTPKGNHGDCRRNPPNGRYEGFPSSNPTDWCGCFVEDKHKADEFMKNKSKQESSDKGDSA